MSYGILGEHLTHSYSPMIHKLLGSYEYKIFEVVPDSLDAFMTRADFDGINVTIPYKKAVIPYLAELSDRAKRIGSVNTVVKRPDGSLYGDNTDYGGFMSLVKKSKISMRGKKALVLGSGGASLTAVCVLRDMGAGEVIVISRSGENNYDNLSLHSDAEIIVNTTPVGMFPNNGSAPLELALFPHCLAVFDLIYNPAKTALMLRAEELGIKAYGGLHMLVAQAVIASGIFFSKKPDMLAVDKIEKKISDSNKNIILIGMPGCGKTAVGKQLAYFLGREFIDTDREIVKNTGRDIPSIFASDGEDYFRGLETECLADVCRRSGCVISTGGGVVTREENKNLIRQNGTVIFIKRNLQSLASRGRPLSETNSPETLWEKRRANYESWSDIKILNTGIGASAGVIMRLLHIAPKHKKSRAKRKDNKTK